MGRSRRCTWRAWSRISQRKYGATQRRRYGARTRFDGARDRANARDIASRRDSYTVVPEPTTPLRISNTNQIRRSLLRIRSIIGRPWPVGESTCSFAAHPIIPYFPTSNNARAV